MKLRPTKGLQNIYTVLLELLLEVHKSPATRMPTRLEVALLVTFKASTGKPFSFLDNYAGPWDQLKAAVEGIRSVRLLVRLWGCFFG